MRRKPERRKQSCLCQKKWDLEEKSRVRKRKEWCWLQVKKHMKKKRDHVLSEWAEIYVFTRDIYSESL